MAQGRNELPIDIVIANIRAAQKQIESLASKPYSVNIDVKNKNFTAPLGKIKGQLGEFEKSLEASNARVIAFGASASAIYAVEKALSESVKSAIEVEKALTDINVILNLSSKSLGEFGTNLFNIAKNTGNTFSTVAEAATELSRQGLGVTETLKRTQDALILTRLSGLGAADSVEAITATLNGFQKAALSSTDVINKLAAVDASFAVSSGDLAEAIKRVGSSAEDAGVSFDQLLAIVTSAQQITARGGAVIGNSFKTIFTRLERPKVLDALQQLGIETQTLAGNTRPVIDILSELAKKYDTLSDRQKSAIAEQVGGVFQINILKAALGDLNKEYSIYSQALATSTGASDEAIRRNEQLNTTLAATLNKTLANLTAAGAKIGELSLAPALKKVMGGLNTALESFSGGDSEDVGNKIGEGLLKGLGNFLSGPGLIVGAKALFTIFERLTTFSADAVKTLLGLNTQAAEQAQIQEQITNLLSKNPQIIAQIASGEATVQSIQESILNTIKAQTLQMEQQTTLAKSLAASLSSAGVSIGRTGAGKGTLQARAGGFVPNLFGEEEQNARSMGAVNPRAQISQGTIGGQKFIKNNKEIEVVGAGRNGDSAVIPTYGSIGDKRQKEFYDKLKFLGFIPNFAKIDPAEMQKNIYATYKRINPAMLIAEGEQSIGSLKYKDATLQYPIIPLSKAGVESEKSIYQQFNSKEAIEQISRMVLDGATNYINSIGYKPPAKEINTDSLMGLFSKNSKYKGAYGALQAFIGAAFEVGTAEALGVSAAASDGGDFDVRNSSNIAKVKKYFPGNYNVADFKVSASKTNRGSMSDKIKKDLDLLLPNLDIIREGEKEAIKGKSLSSAKKTLQEYRQNLLIGDRRTVTKRNPSGISPLDKLIAAKKAKGFIPNFASLKDAMETEKKMGGNPAVDFQEGIGLYVRNKDTQPNFAAVKRDHPEGINNAIKNSKIAQETLARGFIPNFAPLGGGGDAGTGISAQNVALARTMKGLQGKMLAASFAFSTLQGIVETFNKDGKSAFGNIVSGISGGVSTFTSIATVIPNGAGLVIGAFAGLTQAIDSITDSFMNANLEDIITSAESTNENFNKLSDSSQKYAQAFEKLSEINNSSKSTTQDVLKAQQALYEALQDLPDQYRSQFASAKTLQEVQDLTAKALAEGAKGKARATSAGNISKDIEKSRQSNVVFDVLRGAVSKTGLDKYTTFRGTAETGAFTGKKEGMKIAQARGAEITKSLDPKFLEDLKNGLIDVNVKGDAFTKMLEKYGLSADQAAAMTELNNDSLHAGAENFDILRNAIIESAASTVLASDKFKATEEERKKAAAEEEIKAIAVRKAAEADKAAAEAAEIKAAATLQSALEDRKLSTYRQSSMSRIAREAEKSTLQTKQPFITEESMAKGNAMITTNQANSDYAIKTQEAQNTAIEDMTKNLTASIDNQIKELEKSKEKGGEEVTKQIEALQAAKGRISGIVKTGGTAEDVRGQFENLGKDLLPDQVKLQAQNAQIIEIAKADSAKAEIDRAEQIQIAKDNLKAQLQQIKDQQLLKGAGGIQGFLNPETLKDPLERFSKGLEGMTVGKKFGLETTAARGGLEAGIALQEMTGGFGSERLNESLRGQVVPQMAAQKRAIFEGMASQAEAAGNTDLAKIARDAASEAQAMAEKQFDNQFKLQDNVAGIFDLLKNKLKGEGGTKNQTQTGVEKGIEQASTAMQMEAKLPTTEVNAQEPVLNDFQKMFVEEAQKAIAKDSTIAETMPTMREAIGGPMGLTPEETQALMSINTQKTSTGAGPASTTPITAGTFAADKVANTYKEKPMSEWTAEDYKAREKASDEAWNKKMENSGGPLAAQATTGEGIGKAKINQLPAALKQTTGLTGADVKDYLGANESQQQTLMNQRKALEGKTDAESNRKRALLDNQVNALRDRNANAQQIQEKVGMQENPVKEVQRQQEKGRPNQEKLTQAIQENTQSQKEESKKQETSKGQMNVSFTPLSVEVKGSIETASDELSKKMMDAVKKAVEEISPGILAKIYGPAKEQKKA